MSINDLLALDADAPKAFGEVWLGYTEYEGAPELRTEITTLYQTVSPAQILVFSGAEEAIFAYMNTAVGTGRPYHRSCSWLSVVIRNCP